MAVIEAIATTYLEADASSVEFSSIPATYEHLQLRCSCKTTRTGYGTDNLKVYLTTTAAASAAGDNSHSMFGTGTTAGALMPTDSYTVHSPTTNFVDAANYAGLIFDILDYASTTKNTTLSYLAAVATSGAVAYSQGAVWGSMLWDKTERITAVKVFGANGNLVRGSEFTLYGLKSS